MATVITTFTIKCENRKEFKRVGLHLNSCKKHLDGCGKEHSFNYLSNPLLLTYTGAFHEQEFKNWDDQFPLLQE